MSRSGYSDDCDDHWARICWRGAVKSAIRGKRGQAMLRETLAALDSLPEKILAPDSLVNADGQYCTLGALGSARCLDMSNINPEDSESIATLFGISHALAREIMWRNDECTDQYKWVDVEICGPIRPHYPEYGRHTKSVRIPNENIAAERFKFMRSWIAEQIKPNPALIRVD